jgi:hypothetical protein
VQPLSGHILKVIALQQLAQAQLALTLMMALAILAQQH